MSIVGPTLIPRPPVIPLVLPRPPHFGPTPLSRQDGSRVHQRRDFQREMDDLSDEEHDLEDCNLHVRNRGYTWYIPIGRHATQLEEKNDAEEASDITSQSESQSASPSGISETNDESGRDLDASMQDMDEADDTIMTEDDREEDDE